jgi:hypothetical protein
VAAVPKVPPHKLKRKKNYSFVVVDMNGIRADMGLKLIHWDIAIAEV